MAPAVIQVMEPYYVANGVPWLLTWCWRGTDMTFKILLKKLFGIFQCQVNILKFFLISDKKFSI